MNRFDRSPIRIAHICNAHVAAVHLAPGVPHTMAGSCSRPGQSEGQLRRKPTFNCAAQQTGVEPPPPVRWRAVTGRSVTGAVIFQLGNPTGRLLETAWSAKWCFRPIPVLTAGTSRTVRVLYGELARTGAPGQKQPFRPWVIDGRFRVPKLPFIRLNTSMPL
jgi:hypothetical protein